MWNKKCKVLNRFWKKRLKINKLCIQDKQTGKKINPKIMKEEKVMNWRTSIFLR